MIAAVPSATMCALMLGSSPVEWLPHSAQHHAFRMTICPLIRVSKQTISNLTRSRRGTYRRFPVPHRGPSEW